MRASGEGIAPWLHGRTSVSRLHTMHPKPFLRFPQAYVQITRQTSEGGHRTGKLSVRHHVPARMPVCTSPCELSTHTLVHTHSQEQPHGIFLVGKLCIHQHTTDTFMTVMRAQLSKPKHPFGLPGGSPAQTPRAAVRSALGGGRARNGASAKAAACSHRAQVSARGAMMITGWGKS